MEPRLKGVTVDASQGRGVVIHDYVTICDGVRLGARTEVFEGAVLGHPPRATLAVSRPLAKRHSSTIIAPDCVLSPHVVVYSDVRIGRGTLVGDGASIREGSRIGSRCLIGRNVSVNYNALIGNDTKVMDSTHITGNTTIGSHVFIGPLVATVNDNRMGAQGYRPRSVRGPTIQNHVRVGAGAIILPGIVIGEGSVIGAGSVVTRNVPPRRLVMGVPARDVGRTT